MIKNDYTVRSQKFIQQIFPYIERYMMCPNAYKVDEAVCQFNIEKNRLVKFDWGCSRRVLITSDYVVKWDKCEERPFCGSCEDEYKAYLFVKETKFAYLFAEIFKFDYQGYTFYVMPRVYNIHDNSGFFVQDYCTAEEKAFLNEYFHDLHDENYGFKKGRPIIFDYAWNYIE